MLLTYKSPKILTNKGQHHKLHKKEKRNEKDRRGPPLNHIFFNNLNN